MVYGVTRELCEANRHIAEIKDAVVEAKVEVEETLAARDHIHDEIESARSRRRDELAELESITAQDFWDHLKADPKFRENIEAVLEELNISTAQASALDLLRAAREVPWQGFSLLWQLDAPVLRSRPGARCVLPRGVVQHEFRRTSRVSSLRGGSRRRAAGWRP